MKKCWSLLDKYKFLLKYEAKTITRDPINLYMCFFPIIILLLSTLVFPKIFESIDPLKGATIKYTVLLVLIIILTFSSFFLAAMATFLLIENKDERTLHTIAVTPLGVPGYIKFKMGYIYLMTAMSTIIILLGTKLIAGDKYTIAGIPLFDNINIAEIISFAFVNSLFVPSLSLLEGAFAKNKVEGFAYIKGSGLIALIPALMILETFQGGMQYLLGVLPNFWAVKGMMLELLPTQNNANLSYTVYLLIGAAYNILIFIFAYRLFLKKAEY
ncbi:MAG TPA: hypothetical protein PK733_19440 [Clostridiales bacterium]|nr:hypothetical protein [Clostridiales bacterium]